MSELVDFTRTRRRGERIAVNEDINVLALVKGRERYVFLYLDSQRAETLRKLGKFASDPELSFSWYDAAVLSQKLRQNQQVGETSGRRRVNLPQATDVEFDDGRSVE